MTGPAGELRSAAAHVFVTDLASLELDDEDRHHLGRVLRLRTGESVTAADGSGSWVVARVVATDPIELEPVGAVRRVAAPRPEVTVGLALSKGDRTDWAVQKLTEVGVDRIVLLETARGVVRRQGDRAAKGLERLARVARQASMQSRRVRPPALAGPLSVEEAAAAYPDSPVGAAEPGGDPPSLAVPTILVGPEGGWADGEVPDGMPRIGLGDTVMRTETAAVAAGTLLCALRSAVVTETFFTNG